MRSNSRSIETNYNAARAKNRLKEPVNGKRQQTLESLPHLMQQYVQGGSLETIIVATKTWGRLTIVEPQI